MNEKNILGMDYEATYPTETLECWQHLYALAHAVVTLGCEIDASTCAPAYISPILDVEGMTFFQYRFKVDKTSLEKLITLLYETYMGGRQVNTLKNALQQLIDELIVHPDETYFLPYLDEDSRIFPYVVQLDAIEIHEDWIYLKFYHINNEIALQYCLLSH